MNSLSYNTWNGGMTNDPNIGQVGSFYDGGGIEIRRDSKKITLSPSYNNEEIINYRTNGYIIGSIISSSGGNVLASRDGSLSNYIFIEPVYGRNYVSNVSFYNIFRTGNGYGVIIGSDGVYRWTIDNNDNYLGTINTTNIINEGGFDNPGNWAPIQTGWAIASSKLTHTAGNTTAQTQTITTEVGATYIINIDSNITAGTCDIKFDGTTIGTLSTSTNGTIQTFRATATTISSTIGFYPSSTLNGYINEITANKTLVEKVISQSFNQQAPYLIKGTSIYIGNGNEITEIDTTVSVWSATSSLTIDKGFVIRGLTKIGDQIFVYSTDGSMTKQYLWDGVTKDLPSRSITWYDKPLQRVISWNNIDYLIVSNTYTRKASLWLVNGYQPQLICQSDYINNTITDKFAFNCENINSIETIGTKMLFSGISCIYSYGYFSPGFPQSIVREYLYTGNEITSMNYDEANSVNLYYFFTSTRNNIKANYIASQYLIDNNPNNTTPLYSTSVPGYVITLPIYVNTYSQDKQTVKIKIGYNLTHSTQTIKVYYKIDDETNFNLIKTISTNDIKAFSLQKKFRKIQFKLELATGITTKRPDIYDFNLTADFINNDLT